MSFSFSAALNNLVGNTPGANVSNLVQCLNDLKNYINGSIDDTNIVAAGLSAASLSLTEQQRLGLNDGAQIGRGKSIVATEQSTAATTYAVGNLATPDRVSGVVLPTDGLILIVLSALIKNTVANAQAALFLGANQLVVGQPGAGTVAVEAIANQGKYGWLTTTPGYLSYGANAGADSTGGITTGQIVGNTSAVYTGGALAVFANAGTYDVSLQVKNTAGGTVFLKERKLWVWTMGF